MSGGILKTCMVKAETDLLESIEGGKRVPLRQQNGTKPSCVSFVLSRGRSTIVGLRSQFSASEKSSSL